MASRIGGICSPFVVFLVSCVGSKYFRLVELELDDTGVPPGEWGGVLLPTMDYTGKPRLKEVQLPFSGCKYIKG